MAKDKTNVSGQTHNRDAAGEPSGLPPLVQAEIGRRLRAVYGQLAEEPLPDKFTKLLQDLAKADGTEKNQ